MVCHTASGAMGDSSALPSSAAASSPREKNAERTYTPLPRLGESDVHKLLGVDVDANFEEVVVARNFLLEEYRWHEPSREAIELAFEAIMQERLEARNKLGYRPPRTGKRGEAAGYRPAPTFMRRVEDLFDPTITFRTLINEGVIFIGIAMWALTAGDMSFPMGAAVTYSIYKFLSKRTKVNPDGPFFMNNPIVGAVFATAVSLAISFGVTTVATVPLMKYIEGSSQQVSCFLITLMLGSFSVYLK